MSSFLPPSLLLESVERLMKKITTTIIILKGGNGNNNLKISQSQTSGRKSVLDHLFCGQETRELLLLTVVCYNLHSLFIFKDKSLPLTGKWEFIDVNDSDKYISKKPVSLGLFLQRGF